MTTFIIVALSFVLVALAILFLVIRKEGIQAGERDKGKSPTRIKDYTEPLDGFK